MVTKYGLLHGFEYQGEPIVAEFQLYIALQEQALQGNIFERHCSISKPALFPSNLRWDITPPLVPPALTTNALFRWEVERKHLSVGGQS